MDQNPYFLTETKSNRFFEKKYALWMIKHCEMLYVDFYLIPKISKYLGVRESFLNYQKNILISNW